MLSRLGIILLSSILAASLLASCSQRASSVDLLGADRPSPANGDALLDFSQADLTALLDSLRDEHPAEQDTAEYLDELLELYERCVAAGRLDLAGITRLRLSGAEPNFAEEQDKSWLRQWHIRLTLADIRFQVRNQNLLSARRLLEELLARYPEIVSSGNPLSTEVNRQRLELYDRLGLSRLSVLTAWQLLLQDGNQRDRRYYHERLWLQIDTMNPFALQSLSERTQDRGLKEFIDIVSVWRKSLKGDARTFEELIAKYPEHPALEFPIPQSLLIQESYIKNQPDKIALLVPLSGNLAPIGKAIRDGFISAAWMQASQLDAPLSTIDVYDTTIYGNNIGYVLDQAIQTGAELIVGPLRKDMVKQVASLDIPVPMISLNFESDALIPGSPPSPTERRIQMSLSDEDELWQIARMLDQLEVRSAGVLLPESKLGNRLKAFLEDYSALFDMRAELVFDFYAPYEFDHSRAIRQMFELDSSERRAQTLQSRLGVQATFRPRRRGDIAVVLVVADGQQLQSLHSQIQFQAQEPIPVITTSSGFALGKKYADELEGLYMTLMPWLISPKSDLQNLTQTWQGLYDDLSYFFTFGADAWDIANLHRPLLEIEGLRVPIHTGTVRLDEFGRLRREYLWAKFANGQAIEFDPNELKEAIDTQWIPSWKRQLLLD